MRASLLVVLLAACNDQLLTNTVEGDQPAISVTPLALAFDAPGSQVVTISSLGPATLTVSSVELRSDCAFSVTDTGGLPGTMAPDTAVDVVVTWDPSDENDGWLDIVSDDPASPLVGVALSGAWDAGDDTGGTPGDDTGADTGDDTAVPVEAAMLSPESAEFTAEVGDSDSASFTLENTGEVELDLAATVSGDGFTLSSAVPAALGEGDQLVLDVTFTPSAEGGYLGTLEVVAGDLPPLTAALVGTGTASPTGPTSFTWTGSDQTYTVPGGVTSLTVEAWGAGGGAGSYTGAYAGDGGGGGYATATISVSPGDALTIRPGEGGHMPGGGGGASLVWDAGGSLVLVAGAGGGGGTDGGSLLYGSGAGGAGGGSTGSTGGTQFDTYWGSASGGTGGTSSGGGSGGTASLVSAIGPACNGGTGASLQGGGGASGSSSCTTGTAASLDSAGTGSSNGAGGGGGSGYYGGGGGASVYTYFGGGGGGGSSWSSAGSTSGGSGATPGGTSSASWDGSAGTGGTAGSWPTTPSTDGAHGLVVIW